MLERLPRSRPSRSGTRRRRTPRAGAAPEAGASRVGRRLDAHSLDTKNYLATTDNYLGLTVREWSDSQATEAELYRRQIRLHQELSHTVMGIWQRYAMLARETGDPEGREWRRQYDAAAIRREDETPGDRWRRVDLWLKENKPRGLNAKAIRWEKQFLQLERCQREWIGYRAACCKERSRAIAVPIGCNHRLCPLCSYHRSQRARVRIKAMFDRLTHPIFVTLTVPSTATIRKHDFTIMRQRVRKFIKDHQRWFKGGVYSMESTYNRQQRTWHVHVHILADADCALPTKHIKRALVGQSVFAFTRLKLQMEFDWLRLWTAKWSKPCRVDAGQMRHAGDIYEFENWVRDGRANALKEFDHRTRRYEPIAGLPGPEIERRTAWNAENRRVVHIKPVDDREKAAFEVLKYITKGAAFSDCAEAVEQFMDAVTGARLIQTFGSWYGFKIDTIFDPEHMNDWGELKCACGLNCWERMGIFYRRDVAMDESGRWFLKRPHTHTDGGTVPRPTIRALDAEKEAIPWPIHLETR